MNRPGTYMPYLLFMHKLQLLLLHSYHTSNDLAIRPQGLYSRGGGQRQEKYCLPFLLFCNYFSGSPLRCPEADERPIDVGGPLRSSVLHEKCSINLGIMEIPTI